LADIKLKHKLLVKGFKVGKPEGINRLNTATFSYFNKLPVKIFAMAISCEINIFNREVVPYFSLS
jgi:hypothetical protein